MKYLLFTFYLTFILVLGSFAQVPIRIKKINFDHEIDSAINFAVDNDGFFYIYNRNESSIIKLDQNGKFIKKIGSRGRGPDEFLDVSLLLYDNESNLLYAYDMPSFTIKELTTDGEFLNQYEYPDKQMVNPFYGFIQDGYAYLVFYGPYALSQNIVHKTDIKKGKTLYSYYDYNEITKDKNAILKHNFKGSVYGLNLILNRSGDLLLTPTTSEDLLHSIDTKGVLNTILIPTTNENLPYKEIASPKPKKKYRMIDGPATEIYRYVIGLAEVDSTILVFEQSNYKNLTFGYHIFNSMTYEYLGFEKLNDFKPHGKNDDFIYAFPQVFLMAAKGKNLYFGKVNRINDKFSVFRLDF